MKNLKLIFFVLILTQVISAQNIESWESFTSYLTINEICNDNQTIWAATNGGAFGYNTDDQSFISLNKSLGLSSHQITASAIDENGLVWLGDKLGVINIYDPSTGTVQKILDIKNSDKTIKQINNIYIKGNIAYISTAFGLSLVNTESKSFIETIVKFGNFTTLIGVNGIYLDDIIYVCTDKGIAKQKKGYTNLSAPDAWENISLNDEIKVNTIVEFENNLFAATESGLLKKEESSWNTILFANYNVASLKVIDNQLFAILDNTIHKIENSSSSVLISGLGKLSGIIKISNDYYVSSHQGLFLVSENNNQLIMPPSPSTNSFINLSIDNNSNIWAATGKNGEGKGVARYNGTEWISYDRQNFSELPTNDYWNIHASENGKVYFSSWGFGITVFEDEKLTVYNTENSGMVGIPKDNNYIVISDLKTDNSGNAWVLNYLSGSQDVLSVLTPDDNWHHYKLSSPLSPRVLNTNDLLIDQYNNKWFTAVGDEEGYSEKGLYRFNENGTFENISDDSWLRLTNADGLHSDLVTALAVDNFGELWIGTSSGLNFINNPSETDPIIRDVSFTGKTLFEGNPITCLAVDAINNKWVGTNEGVYQMNSDCSQLINHYHSENSPIPVDNIISLAIDNNNGKIYVGTDFGLTALQTSAQKPKTEFDKLFTYPSPFIINDGTNNILKISGLVRNSIIKIVTVSGNLVKVLETPGGGMAYWDGRKDDGGFVSSGIYIILAYDEGAENFTSSKIAVIRK